MNMKWFFLFLVLYFYLKESYYLLYLIKRNIWYYGLYFKGIRIVFYVFRLVFLSFVLKFKFFFIRIGFLINVLRY